MSGLKISFLLFILFTVGLSQPALPNNTVFNAAPTQTFSGEVRAYKTLNTEDALLSLDDKNITIRSASGQKRIFLPEYFIDLYTSRSGAYFAVTALIPQKKYQPADKQLQVDVYSAQGNLLYTIQRHKHYDDPIPQVVVSDNDGSLILGESAEGRLFFYSSNGQLIRRVVLFTDANYDLERTLQIAVNAAGDRITVLAGKRSASPLDSDAPNPSAEPYLFLFDADGIEQWRKPLAQTTPQNVAISPDGSSVFAGSFSAYTDGRIEKRTQLFRENGTVINALPLLFRSAEFLSSDAKALLADRSTVYLVDARNGKITAQKAFPPEKGMITAARFDREGNRIFVLTARNRFEDGRFIFKQPALHILTPKGTTVQTMPFPNETFIQPALQIDNDQVFIGFMHHLYKIEKTR